MADNVTFQTVALATAPDATVVATDDVGGVQYQRVKLDVGGDGVTTPVTVAAPLPVAPIAGQVGVAGGAGAVSALVQRTTLASDDPAVATLGATTGVAVTTDANGTIQQYLRGLVKLAITTGGWLSNITQWGSNAVTGGAGAVAAGTPRVTLASDDPAVATLGATAGAAVTTDANGTIQQYLRGLVKLAITSGSWLSNITQWGSNAVTGGAGAVAAGTPRVTLASDDPAVAVLGATSGAKVITDANGTIQQYLRGIIYQLITAGASFVTPTPAATGGWSIFNATSGDGSTALTNSAQSVKSSQGTLGGWYIYNPNTSAAYVIIYNVASGSVTVGTTNPAMVLAIPAGAAANLELTNGLQFSTAITVAATATAAGNGAPTTALDANFWYK